MSNSFSNGHSMAIDGGTERESPFWAMIFRPVPRES